MEATLIQIAEQHSRMVEVAIMSGEEEKAHAAVRAAFVKLVYERANVITLEDDICTIISPRIASILGGAGIETIDELCSYSRDELVAIHQIRYKSVDLIERALQREGFELRR